jgi:hypothetical protein
MTRLPKGNYLGEPIEGDSTPEGARSASGCSIRAIARIDRHAKDPGIVVSKRLWIVLAGISQAHRKRLKED